MPKPKNPKVKIAYEMACKGMLNPEIAEKLCVEPRDVANYIARYIRQNNAPKPIRGKNKISGWGSKGYIEDDEQRREREHRASKREDGVLKCPVRYCEGYGF